MLDAVLGHGTSGDSPRTVFAKPAATVTACVPDFAYQDMLPLGADDTPYRLLTADYVSTFEAGGRRFLQVDPEALTLLTKTAMFDIAHLLRPGHLAQLAAILDDPEASPNDVFVATRAAEERVHRGRRHPARRARTPAPRS